MVGSDERHPADAIVIGAGVAAAAAAARMARAGLAVVLVDEHGSSSGPVKSYSGVVDERVLARTGIEPPTAPCERMIVHQERWWMSPDSVLRSRLHVEASHLHTALSARLVDSLVGVAATNGATRLSDGGVRRLITHGGRVVGIITRSHAELYASTVVLATDHVCARRLLESAPGSEELEPATMATGGPAVVTESQVDLPVENIEDRFGLPAGGGATVDCLGVFARGTAGHAFLRTCRASISIGVVVLLAELAAGDANGDGSGGISADHVLEAFIAHPAVAPYVRGGTIKDEKSQVFVLSGNFARQYHGPGYLIAPSPRVFDGSFTTQLLIGEAAGNTAIRCKEKGDFSPITLREYSMLIRRLREADTPSNVGDLSVALRYDFHRGPGPRRLAKAFLGSEWNTSRARPWSKLASSLVLRGRGVVARLR